MIFRTLFIFRLKYNFSDIQVSYVLSLVKQKLDLSNEQMEVDSPNLLSSWKEKFSILRKDVSLLALDNGYYTKYQLYVQQYTTASIS